MKQLILFSSNWCSSCQVMKPTVESVSKQLGIQLANVDTDYDISFTSQYNVKSIPTVVLLENGVEKKRFTGVQTEQALKNFING